jgi:hypothetical protein
MLKPERVAAFKELLALFEEYRRKNGADENYRGSLMHA